MVKENVANPCNGILFGHKKNEVLIQTTTGMNLEHIVLNERSQTHERLHIVGFHLYEISSIGRSIEKVR